VELKKTLDHKGISIDDTLRTLDTSMDGLSQQEALSRLERLGPNRIVKERENPIIEFLSHYWGPTPWLLEIAIVLAYFLGHYIEALLIFVLLTINVVIGTLHIRSSRKALGLLEKRLAIKAKVMRDGKWAILDAGEMVPGDVFLTGLGDMVPADAKVVSGEVSVDQSSLTGESLPAHVNESDVIYSSSIVVQGEAKCVVVNTGKDSYFGKTAELIKVAAPKSHQEEIMISIIQYMMYVGVIALLVVAGYSVYLHKDLVSILTFAVIFLIGAVPVALPAVMVIVQTVGATELSKKGVLVTRLDSIEDAASMDILCLDKTGTITQNKLSVVELVPSPGFKPEDVALIACLASKAESKDPIDLAVLEHTGSMIPDISQYTQESFAPFEPSKKRSEALIEFNGHHYKAIKGAPQVIVAMCKGLSREDHEKIHREIVRMSELGYRTLGVGRSKDGVLDDIQFVGLLSMADPVRPDSRKMIEDAKKLGVKPMMLTGDNINIAKEIASQTGIGDKFVRMSYIKGLKEDEQAKVVEAADGLAEIYPEDKYKIVKLLQSRGHIVGMTGDGVNDAPALRQAEMGIAVSNSADVAKAAASMVLTEDGIGVIINAINTSRMIYQRMLSWVINKITKTVQVIGLLTLGFFWFHDIVISILGMSLLLLANDFVTMSLATDNVKHTASPNAWNVKNITLASMSLGLLLVIEGLIALAVGTFYFHLGWLELTTFITLMLIFTSQFRILVVREREHFWSSMPDKGLLTATALTIILFVLVGIYGIIIPPLNVSQVLFILGFSAVFTLSLDVPKYYIFKLVKL